MLVASTSVFGFNCSTPAASSSGLIERLGHYWRAASRLPQPQKTPGRIPQRRTGG